MSYTEHDETMGDLGLEGITASGTAESSPAGASQEASGVERGDPAGDRTEDIAPVLDAGTEEEATAPAAQTEGGGLDPPGAPLSSGESEQTGGAGPETLAVEKPKRKRVSRKKAAESSAEDTSGGEASGEDIQVSGAEDASSGASDDLSVQGGDTPEHDDDEDLETDAFVLSDGGEEMPPTPLEGTGDDDIGSRPSPTIFGGSTAAITNAPPAAPLCGQP